jgi:hypothetical protein
VGSLLVQHAAPEADRNPSRQSPGKACCGFTYRSC